MEARKLPPKAIEYTYEEYLTWPEEERWEMIEGVTELMASPAFEHQWLLLELASEFRNHLRGKPCIPIMAPMDVRLENKRDHGKDTVLQPDLMVVCDRSKIEKNFIMGAPDFVLEVLSPSTEIRDLTVKMRKYLQAGVQEYWVLDPIEQTLQVYLLIEGTYRLQIYERTDQVPVQTVEGLIIHMSALFPDDLTIPS